MHDTNQEIQTAVLAHQRGELQTAEKLYSDILSREPNHLGAMQLMGALCVQTHRVEEAIPILCNVLQAQPKNSVVWGNLGTAYSRLKRFDDAIGAYRAGLRCDPNNKELARNLGSVLMKARRYPEAAEILKIAHRMLPLDSNVQLNLGISLLRSRRDEEAAAILEGVVQREPENRQALAGLGQALMKKDEEAEKTEKIWRKLLEIEPENQAIHNNLATALKLLGRFEESVAACRRAMEIAPDYFPAQCNLGLALASMQQFSQSLEALRKACDMYQRTSNAASSEKIRGFTPELWQEFGSVAFCQLAAVSNQLGHHDEAEQAISKAIEIEPENSDSRLMRGFLKLQKGEFEKGWHDYEYRRKTKLASRAIPGQEWKGEIAPNSSILLHAEQGLGDTIQFIRYASLVRERVGKVHFLCHKPLVNLIRSCPFLDSVVKDGDPLPQYDFQIPLLSLPAVYESSMETLPRQVPYLFSSGELIELWRQKLAHLSGFRIAIAWQGNPEFANDQQRRVPLEKFSKIAAIPGVDLISIQKGFGTDQLEQVDFKVHDFPEADTVNGAFLDTAAIMHNVDLVISPCTANPHLAGALGRPVWLAKSFAAEWRWMSDDRPANPWYPTMKMFRQKSLGDWDSVFQPMAEEIVSLLTSQQK